MPRQVKAPIALTEDEKLELQKYANSRSLPHSLVMRAKIILLANEDLKRKEIKERCSVTYDTINKWCKRYSEYGIDGLYDEFRSGKPRAISDERVAELVKKTLESKPKGSTHWSIRTMAEETGISKSTVQRIWSAYGIQPHRQTHFKLSTDPFFVEKVHDIVGLYLNPPENALVLCVDEKSQCQALERSQPMLPMGCGYVEGVTHDYYRHGTTTVFAALDIANGKVITKCQQRHRHEEFLSFLRLIKKEVPENMDIHVVLDNYAPHKHPKVKGWLARNERFHFHFTPTYSSWINQVERWFGIITDKAIRRDSFSSVKELREKIDLFVDSWNESAAPFKWTATAESILNKIERLCLRINGSAH